MKLMRTVRKLHKLTAAVVGVQLFLWVVSGLYMTAVPIDIVRGNHLVDKAAPSTLQLAEVQSVADIVEPEAIIYAVELKQIRQRPIYKLHTESGLVHVDASNGEPVLPLTAIEAENIARAVYKGAGTLAHVTWLSEDNAPQELGNRPLPAWQLQYDDFWRTTLYISAYSGEISAVRSDIWRWFDFLWMLHIMDYDEREDFNNPLVIFMASLATLLILSGFLLLFNVIKHKGWRFGG